MIDDGKAITFESGTCHKSRKQTDHISGISLRDSEQGR